MKRILLLMITLLSLSILTACGQTIKYVGVSPKQTVVSPTLKSYAKCGKAQVQRHGGMVSMRAVDYDCTMLNAQRCAYNAKVLKIALDANIEQMSRK